MRLALLLQDASIEGSPSLVQTILGCAKLASNLSEQMSELVSAWTDAYTAVLQAQAAHQAEMLAHHLPVLLAYTQTSSPYISQVTATALLSAPSFV